MEYLIYKAAKRRKDKRNPKGKENNYFIPMHMLIRGALKSKKHFIIYNTTTVPNCVTACVAAWRILFVWFCEFFFFFFFFWAGVGMGTTPPAMEI